MLLAFLFTYVPYAIVIENCGAVEGLRKGLRVLRRSFADTVIVWAIVGLLAFASSLVFFPLQYFGFTGEIVRSVLTALLNWLVVAPFTTFVWIQLYRSKMI